MLSNIELTNLGVKELQNELIKARQLLMGIKIKLKSKQTKAIHNYLQNKKYVARLLTFLNQQIQNKKSEIAVA